MGNKKPLFVLSYVVFYFGEAHLFILPQVQRDNKQGKRAAQMK